ncbi:ribonuclease Y, partial [Striga asiatica]
MEINGSFGLRGAGFHTRTTSVTRGGRNQKKKKNFHNMEEKINLNGGCDFFSWVDPPTCDRPEKIMPGLVKKMKALERANENFKFENTKLEEKVEKLEEKIEKLQKKVEKLQALNKRLVEKKEKMEMKMGFALAIATLLCVFLLYRIRLVSLDFGIPMI